jgi:very-short-patch-repair endonuclease
VVARPPTPAIGATPAAPLPPEGRGKGWGCEHAAEPLRQPTPTAKRAAAGLRKRTTDAEKELWWHLRRRTPTTGSHFRRQVALGPYVVDFCCHKHRIVVELDASQHATEAHADADRRRDAFLAERGYRVLRFWNTEVFEAMDSVLDTIFAALATQAEQAPPPPTPPLKGEGRAPDSPAGNTSAPISEAHHV